MAGVIHLLPESIANQIAAGEVIQRPASLVKELLENSLDAGSKNIKLIIKDAGKTSIQIIDDGCGMSEMDARMCFERHATSKIRTSADLFRIKSFGFRGEALASIAAVAQVELRTRKEEEPYGTRVLIEASQFKAQEPYQSPVGTSILVKNLFFNVPARRKFLKSDPVELKHILEEFIRVALPNPEVFFNVYHGETELYHFPSSNLRQRIVNYFGKGINDKLIPVSESSDILEIQGFIGKPELIKKSRGDQYLFVNQRFIKSPYLNHAVRLAYDSLISPDSHPFYVLMLRVDPETIDINIHPTKQEIKFENERLIYNYLKVALKHSLGKYSLTPMIDFEAQSDIFGHVPGSTQAIPSRNSGEKREWLNFYREISETTSSASDQSPSLTIPTDWSQEKQSSIRYNETSDHRFFQLNDSYLISPIKSGLLIIDQHSAHERILYEKNLKLLESKNLAAQQNLFPETFSIGSEYAETLVEVNGILKSLGFHIDRLGQTSFIIHSVPADNGISGSASDFILNFVVSYTANLELQLGIKENIARSLAVHSSINKGKSLEDAEIRELIDKLFACEHPFTSPSGKKCFITIRLDELENKFR